MMKVLAPIAGVSAALLLTAGLTLAPAPPARASNTYYACGMGTPIPFNWAGKNPKECKGVYKIEVGGVSKLTIDNRRVKDWNGLIKRFSEGYASAQKWCASNSLTCTVVTTVGLALVKPLWSIANSRSDAP